MPVGSAATPAAMGAATTAAAAAAVAVPMAGAARSRSGDEAEGRLQHGGAGRCGLFRCGVMHQAGCSVAGVGTCCACRCGVTSSSTAGVQMCGAGCAECVGTRGAVRQRLKQFCNKLLVDDIGVGGRA
eukprot:360468-Chlamydomonas_euryale.AAC.5